MQDAAVQKTSLMRAIERCHGGKDIREVIRDRYRELGTIEAVADDLGISREAIYQWIERFDGAIRTEIFFPGLPQPVGVAA